MDEKVIVLYKYVRKINTKKEQLFKLRNKYRQTFREYSEAGNQNMLCNHQTNDILEQPFSWEEQAQLVLRRSLTSSWKRLLSQIITSRRETLRQSFSNLLFWLKYLCSKISLTSISLGKMECFLSSVLRWYLKSKPKDLTMNNFVVISQSVETFT